MKSPHPVRKSHLEKIIPIISLIFILIFIVIYLFFTFINPSTRGLKSQKQASEKHENDEEVIKETYLKPPFKNWWNMEYAFAYQLQLANRTQDDIENGDEILLEPSHPLLQTEHKLIFLDDNETFKEISYTNKENNIIAIKISNKIKSNSIDERFFIYSKNLLPEDFTVSAFSDKTQASNKNTPTGEVNKDSKFQASVIKKVDRIYSSSFSRKWLLKGNAGEINPNYLTLSASLKIGKDYLNDEFKLDWIVVGTDVLGSVGVADIPESGEYTLTIDSENLPAGQHIIEVTANEGNKITYPFNVSYPLYATWTMDWEGYDVKDEYLTTLDRLSRENSMPITHFFNPRIFITSGISKERATYLTTWVKERAQNEGHSIGLHLHMHYDFIESAGLVPRTEISWENSVDGYEVTTSSYSPEEFNKIVSHALDLFRQNNLPSPIGYRAGGWFINLDNLKVLPSLGFKYDSSAREEYYFGSKGIKGFWTHDNTVKPYNISALDQNSPQPPNIDLWEFPNNGADSTNSISKNMILQFQLNYSGLPLQDRQVMTFLSHPHWFNQDTPRLEELFKEMNKYKIENDNGPVIYTNLDETYRIYSNL